MEALTATPLQYQYDAAQFLIANQCALLHADMGTGKSLMALLAFHHLHSLGIAQSCLILTTKSIAHNFLDETKKHFTGFNTNLFLGPNRKITNATCTISTYDLVLDLHKGSWDCVILDEIHILRNPKTLKHIHTLTVTQKATFVWGLSGTPLVNRIKDLRAAAALTGVQWSKNWLDIHRFRICKNLSDLPPISHLVKDFPIHDLHSHRLVKSQAALLIANYLDHKTQPFANILAAITKLRTIASVNSNKFNYIHQLSGNIVVFSNFKQSLLQLAKSLPPSTLTLFGDTVNRQDVIQKFQQSGGILLSTFGTGGVGINLTNAHHIVLLDPAWNFAAHAQAFDRAHRIGSSHHLHTHTLLSSHSIESWIWQIVCHKKTLMSSEKPLDKSHLTSLLHDILLN
jgi:SNF2 family DNA or RNA helicase